MTTVERVTVTLTDDLIKGIDRLEKNRSKFVADAVRREIERRRRMELHRSLQNPHPESTLLADVGMEEWSQTLPDEDALGLMDSNAGQPLRWVYGEGWIPGPLDTGDGHK